MIQKWVNDLTGDRIQKLNVSHVVLHFRFIDLRVGDRTVVALAIDIIYRQFEFLRRVSRRRA